MVGRNVPGRAAVAGGVVHADVWPDIDGGRLRAAYPSAVQPTYYTVTDGDLLLSLAATFVISVELGDTRLTTTCLGNVFTFPGDRRRDWAAGW